MKLLAAGLRDRRGINGTFDASGAGLLKNGVLTR